MSKSLLTQKPIWLSLLIFVFLISACQLSTPTPTPTQRFRLHHRQLPSHPRSLRSYRYTNHPTHRYHRTQSYDYKHTGTYNSFLSG